MKNLLVAFICVLSISSLQALSVASLNIEWFGRGGRIEGNSDDEYRQKRLQEFLVNELPKSDVYAFQEIMNMEQFKAMLPHLECHTYSEDNLRVQHVVLCADPSIILSKGVDEPTRLGRFGLRPAVVLKVKDHDGSEVSVATFHLKAGRDSSETRLDQMRAFAASSLITEKSIIIGDFNTYDKGSTGLAADDKELISDVLSPIGFADVENTVATFLGYNNRIFDHAWVKGLGSSSAKVVGPCNQSSVSKPFSSYGFFKRFVSDHCALYLTTD